jgi:hypothetical protein
MVRLGRTPVRVRRAHLHNIRAAGFLSLDHYNEVQKQNAATRELAHKQAMERAALDETHAEASAAAAGEVNKDAREAARKQQAEEANRLETLRLGQEARHESLFASGALQRPADGTGMQAENPELVGG